MGTFAKPGTFADSRKRIDALIQRADEVMEWQAPASKVDTDPLLLRLREGRPYTPHGAVYQEVRNQISGKTSHAAVSQKGGTNTTPSDAAAPAKGGYSDIYYENQKYKTYPSFSEFKTGQKNAW